MTHKITQKRYATKPKMIENDGDLIYQIEYMINMVGYAEIYILCYQTKVIDRVSSKYASAGWDVALNSGVWLSVR